MQFNPHHALGAQSSKCSPMNGQEITVVCSKEVLETDWDWQEEECQVLYR